ncbi:B12-binding domain-containing radical SAM protein [Candidatus Sumerlaeota bacterium]|nr:B12-binding domain-containing radical SAM protein [Candidatus Sumerlaeota bacterium]
MRVTLVYLGRYHVREALDLETLASVLRAAGHEARLVNDPGTFGVTDNVLQIPRLARMLSSPEKVARRIVDSRPETVLFSVLPNTYVWSRDMAHRVRAALPDAPIVFMGLHPSLVPERAMADPEVDYVIQGETENVVNPLLDAIRDAADPATVGNLWHRDDNGEAKFTFRAPLVDLDALPLPDKDLFGPHVADSYSYTAMVSRGCPFVCSFCEETCSKNLYGSAYFRRKSVETVMRELVEAKKRYKFREVIFKDSYLSGNKTWLRELMARYRAEIGVPFKCFCTIVGFDDETAALLKESGCYNIEFGLQTWNERIRNEILKRRETNDEAFETFDACARHKLRYDVDHMFNLPTETEDDHRDAALAYRKLRYMNRIKVHYLLYLPTAPILEDAISAGDLSTDIHKRLAEGWGSDFYHQDTGGIEHQKSVAGYSTLYKTMPILPGFVFNWFVRRSSRVRLLRFQPSLVTAFWQLIVAIKGRDLRFWAYIRSYPRKAWQSLLGPTK